MTEQHPITPPPELFSKWLAEARRLHPGEPTGFLAGEIALLAYRAGADQELEACLKDLSLLWDKEEIVTLDDLLKHLRAARRPRPKPPTLKEKLTEALYNENIGEALRLVEQLND